MVPDKSTLNKARIELEELYSGIPDDSVNLTFQDIAEVHQSNGQKRVPPMEALTEASPRKEEVSPLARMPSLDFNRGFEGFERSDHPIHFQNPSHHRPPHVFPLHTHYETEDSYLGSPAIGHVNRAAGGLDHGYQQRHDDRGGKSTPTVHQYPHASPYSHAGFSPSIGTGMYEDMSHMSGMSMADRGGRRRPGIPHSNICTVCSTYIYIFRHRCLVCGRAYCRQCVGIGMSEMTEGRKCVECLGRRFSQRYIQRAGKVGCCLGYPSTVKQQELKWAEKGPRKSGENRYDAGGMVSQSVRCPAPRIPGRPHTPSAATTSFVMSSPYSPYHSPTNHPLPF